MLFSIHRTPSVHIQRRAHNLTIPLQGPANTFSISEGQHLKHSTMAVMGQAQGSIKEIYQMQKNNQRVTDVCSNSCVHTAASNSPENKKQTEVFVQLTLSWVWFWHPSYPAHLGSKSIQNIPVGIRLCEHSLSTSPSRFSSLKISMSSCQTQRTCAVSQMQDCFCSSTEPFFLYQNTLNWWKPTPKDHWALPCPQAHTVHRRWNSASGPEKWKQFYSAMQVKAVSTWLGVLRFLQGWTLLQNHIHGISPQELQHCDPCPMCSTPGCVSTAQKPIPMLRHCSSLNRGVVWDNLAWTEPACRRAPRSETICASAITFRNPQRHWQKHLSSLWFISC